MCFFLLTGGATQGHHLMSSGTKYSGSSIGDELTYKAKKVVKIWSQHGRVLVNSSFQHKFYQHETPALTIPGSNLDCGQPQRHHAGPPSQRYQAPGNNNVTPPQLPSVSTPVDTSSFPVSFRHHLQTDGQ